MALVQVPQVNQESSVRVTQSSFTNTLKVASVPVGGGVATWENIASAWSSIPQTYLGITLNGYLPVLKSVAIPTISILNTETITTRINNG
tara:strand:+ start:7473 stop:7742 length:270 start_codon:yes stop_codon:yes gene_type:complete